jgi:putative phosphoesterase
MIGIISDSHDNRTSLQKAVQMFNHMKCDLVVHAGDFVAPFAARELVSLNCPVKAVFGNCDGEREGLKKTIKEFGEIWEPPHVFFQKKIKFVLTHVHTDIMPLIKKNKPDILVFGHTHKPTLERREATWIINPGESGGWLSGKSTVAVLDPSRIKPEILTL